MTSTPGTYLRLRREAAGLSLREFAYQFASPPELPVAAAEQLLADAEGDIAPLGPMALSRLYLFLAIDIEIYQSLVAGVPAPTTCSGCGCSWWLPCRHGPVPCSWADSSGTICTRCAQAKAA